jgi:hypothetical protein
MIINDYSLNIEVFNIDFYRKYNNDLKELDDVQLLEHFNNIGKNQLRIYFPLSFFKKDIIYIQTTKFGYYISNAIKYILFKNFIISNIIYNINYKNPNLHIILFSQKVKKFPKNYIIYQLEQKDISKWIDKKYELSILYSKKSWDYSKSNINKFSDILQKKITYLPIPLININYINNNIILNNNPRNNILFYGSMNDIRKDKLEYLQKKLYPKYFIKIINNTYGIPLFNEIINSKIVLNIHFYKGALLETNRLNEILSCKKLIISEKPDCSDNYNYELYKNNVVFIETIDEMFKQIIYYLENDNLNKYSNNLSYNNLDFSDLWKNEINNNLL